MDVTPDNRNVIQLPRRRLRPNVVIALPRRVDKQETERLSRAQITHFMLITRRHGAERSRGHRNGIRSVLTLVADCHLNQRQ